MSDDQIMIQIGNKFRSLNTNQIPAVGTQIIIHKHLTETGSAATVEVTRHEWQMIDANENGNAFMQIWVYTKIVN